MRASKINYYWRLFATFLAFSFFGIGGLIISLTICPLLYIVPIEKAKKVRFSRQVVRLSFRVFIWYLKTIGILTYEFRNIERVRKREALFIVANHPTLLDVVFLISIADLPNCVVKQAVWSNPFMFCIVRTLGFIKNSTDPEELLLRCKKVLEEQDGLLLFPEGTRTEPNGEIVLKRAVAHIALGCQKKITPVRIRCEPIMLSKKHRWYNIPLEGPPHFCIEIQEDINVGPFLDLENGRTWSARHLTKHIEEQLKKE